ncbi:hypothetical protein Nepgr_000710 [Nepenthes gracilis]|uniref:Fanconi anemia group D2 protein n=1 Tax=Nepenthes gracilis TaxID=150966 RepID=A0AAD3P3D2_NEPGR|nr:hypothetical protein Nepgr_000710 [Nepenthes gracilis]
MVFLHQQLSSRKRPSSSFVPPFHQSKNLKSAATAAATVALTSSVSHAEQTNHDESETSTSKIEKMVSVLAGAGCTLVNPSGPPCLPSDLLKFRSHLHRIFSSDSALRADFLEGFSSYIQPPANFRRILIFANRDGSFGCHLRSDSVVRNLLLVPSIQIDLQNMLLEKLPEYFLGDPGGHGLSSTFENDIARLIINQFRWLDFLVDSTAFTDKMLQVLSISPLHLKKEIIGSLPEMIGDQNNKAIVDSFQQMLLEDPTIAVPVLDSFSNLNLDAQLHDQAITIALSCIRTIDADSMPHLLRFLLLSATPVNVRRIISQIRNQLKFVGASNAPSLQHSKLKGTLLMDNVEASILDALRSSLRFKNILCEEILKELKSLDKSLDHKVIDIWLLLLIYMNGEPLRKNVEKIFKKKAAEGSFTTIIIDQCIRGNKDLVKEYFPSFLSLSEQLLSCKEEKVREFGTHMYICLFEEFIDTVSRQEVLGALIAHLGSGPSFEVNSALEILLQMASKYPQELVPHASHINGILDFLEGFSVENLHKVYEVFSLLTFSARFCADSMRSSIRNELLMIVRKQVGNPDLKYKNMGIIGTLKIVSFLGDATNANCASFSQKSNCDEAFELLKLSLESCKQVPLQMVLFYDELSSVLNSKTLYPYIMEWIGKHLGDFESLFLSDLDGGKLPVKDSYCGVEGELWMNLDGDISPICLNILPLVSSSLQSASVLQFLPANLLLMSIMERSSNQGSLGGIDALLGCPLYLPSSKYFSGSAWQSLTGKQKEIICLSIYYACNWLRELLNIFCTQVVGNFQGTNQTLKEEIVTKLLKRLRNLVYLESLLNFTLKHYPFSLPEVHFHGEQIDYSFSSQPNHRGQVKHKNVHKKANESNFSNREGKHGKNNSLSHPMKERTLQSEEHQSCISEDQALMEVVGVAIFLESERAKFRSISTDCHSLLTFSKNQDSCCSDPAAELILHSYLLHDLHYKLRHFSPPSKQFSDRCPSAPPGSSWTNVDELLSNIKPLLPSLRKGFDAAVSILKKGTETCQDHWRVQSLMAENPELIESTISNSSILCSIVKETLSFFSRVLNLPDTMKNKSFVLDLLKDFQPVNRPDSILSDVQLILLSGTLDYLYCGAYSFLEDLLEIVCSFSIKLASEVLLTLKSVLLSYQKFPRDSPERNGKNSHGNSIQGLLPTLQKRLGTSALKLLRHSWDNVNLENGWKGQSETLEKILRIYLENSGPTSDVVNELACSLLPQASSGKMIGEEDYHGFPSLCSATFLVWYKTLHEENLNILNKLVKDIRFPEKPRAGIEPEIVEKFLIELQQCVNIVVSLVNMCRTYDKVTVHAMAVKYGGKFVDSFLRAFEFLQTHFGNHSELIVLLVKELQKATRTIQTLCSEAKGLKQTTITTKIPATKRSMERFLFHVKSLLHTTSGGCTFWMGNLKHKDLSGQLVSSQVYTDDQNINDRDPMEADVVEPPCNDSTGGQEAEQVVCPVSTS